MVTCKFCSKKFNKREYEHSLDICSFDCLKGFKEKKKLKFPVLNYRVIHQIGRGKHHSIWVQEKNKKQKLHT